MRKVKNGDKVTVTYVGELADGEIFESSEDVGALEIEIGSKSVLPGFEKALIGMTVGQEKSVTLEPDEAYGPRRPELTHTVNRKVFEKKVDPQPGMVLSMTVDREGKKHKVPVLIGDVDGEKVMIDFNHPLAGKALTYKITLVAISK